MSERETLCVRGMRASDVEAADFVTRTAFGTHWGLSEPHLAFGDVEQVRTRFIASPNSAFVAERDGEIVGSVLATRWGSSGFFGPLAVRPDLWGQGVAQRLLEPVIQLFDDWHLAVSGLFTFPESPKHVGLYQRYGFHAQNLTALVSRGVTRRSRRDVTRFGQLSSTEKLEMIPRVRELTSRIFPGLDVSEEIENVEALDLGDTVLLEHAERLVGVAVCHCGAGEAGSLSCYVKFAGVEPGPRAEHDFLELLRAVETYASHCGVIAVNAGVALSRRNAQRVLIEHGYRTVVLGLRMHRPDVVGYCRSEDFVLDDLR